MRVIDTINAPWAIMSSSLDEIVEIYSTHLRGDKIDIEAIEARLGRPLNNSRTEAVVTNGVAVITAEGIIAKRANLLTKISGGVSTELIANDLDAALEDDEVKAIILDIDSPGGTVDGTFELADKIFAARGTKTVVSYANGTMASAAYAIGSAAEKVFISSDTTQVGSIGVVSKHIDTSGRQAKEGVIEKDIFAGKFKRIASANKPLSEEGEKFIQDQVDAQYKVFVERVALFRDVPVSTVLEEMAEGRIFIGQQAIQAGLVDGVSTLESLIESLANDQLPTNKRVSGAAQISTPKAIKLEDKSMSNDKLTAALVSEKHPEIAAHFTDMGKAEGKKEGATAERERIQDVLAQSMPGHEKLVQALAFDGETTGAQAAVKVLAAEKEARANYAADQLEDAKQGANQVGDAAVPQNTEASADDDDSLPIEQRAKAAWDKDNDLRAEFGEFDDYLAFEKANESGQAKILGKGS